MGLKIRQALFGFLYSLSLVFGIAIVLFLTMDSGLLGDPAYLEVGKHSSPQRLGEARLRLGYYEHFEPEVLKLELTGPPQRFTVRFEQESLRFFDFTGEDLILTIDLNGNLGELVQNLSEVPIRDQWRLDAYFALSESEWREESATGLFQALENQRLHLDAGRDLSLSWALPVATHRRFFHQVKSLLIFDFGQSNATRQPIGREIRERGFRSLALSVPALLLSTTLALLLAMLTALYRQRLDRILSTLAVAAMSITALAYILFIQKWFAADLQWFPVFGWASPYWTYLLLPILIWTFIAVWPDFRYYRTFLRQQSQMRFVQTARAKGLGNGQVLYKHVLPNTLIPIVTQIILALPHLLLGSLLLERFFGIPGLGGYTVDAVMNQDAPVVRATTFIFSLLYLAAQWLADILYLWLDPRLKRPDTVKRSAS